MARTAADLEEAAAEISSATGSEVVPVAGDFNKREDRDRVLAACPEPDIVVNNPGVRQVPTPYQDITSDEWLQWLNDHFLSSISMIQATAPGMAERGFGRIGVGWLSVTDDDGVLRHLLNNVCIQLQQLQHFKRGLQAQNPGVPHRIWDRNSCVLGSLA